MLNAYIYLAGAILFEVGATTFLKASDGFSKPWPSLATVFGYAICFYLLSQSLRIIPTGVAYAIWSGVGIVLISLVAWIINGQKLDLAAIAGLSLIVIGVLVINLFSSSGSH